MAAYWIRTCLILLTLLLFSCYPTEKRHRVTHEDLTEGKHVKVPTKIHLLNGSVILCDYGFVFYRDTILAYGLLYSFSGIIARQTDWAIPLDSVAAMEYFDKSVDGARIPGSLILGTVITGEAALGAVIILKAIFGSCPTVYSFKGSEEHLEAECFSYSIGRKFEMADVDRLSRQELTGERLTLRVKNEALETHYINEFALCYVDHPAGTEIFPTDEGDLIPTRNLVSPSSAVNSEGRNILGVLRDRDSLAYTCDSASVSRMFAEKRNDWIDCVVPRPRNASTMTVAIRGKNSLENTVLFYDVMMRNQGLHVLEWSREISENSWYAWKLAQWYKEFTGIEILVYHSGEYVPCGKIFDTGPIAWRLAAAQFPVKSDGDSVRVRLRFLPDNWTIDWIGFDFDADRPPPVKYAPCIEAKDNRRSTREDALRAIRKDDGEYFVTYPGEWTDLTFAVPPRQDTERVDRTYFIHSKGYYIEWIRPEWVRERPDIPGFDISNRDEIAQRLPQLWLSRKNNFEEQFYHDRIPSWGPGERP